MKKWKNKMFVGLGAVATTIAPIASSVAMSTNVEQKQTDNLTYSKLYDLLHNYKKLNTLVTGLPDYKNLAKEAHKSTEYNNFVHWLKQQNYQTQMDETLILKEIESVNLDRELKIWLLKNYSDKYWMALLNDPTVPVASNKNWPTPTLRSTYWATPDHPITPEPTPAPPVTYRSNNVYYVDAQNKVVEYKENGNTVPRRGIDDKKTDYGFWTDKTWFYFSNQTVFQHGIVMFATKANELLKTVVTDATTSTIGSVLNEIVKKLEIAGRFAKISARFIASSFTSTIVSAISLDWQNDPAGAAQALATSVGVSLLSFGASYITPGFLPGLIVGLAVTLILDAIPTGNGYSIASNMSDHGLNDWNYQWKENSQVMKDLEIEWSNQYKDGIIWEVVDTMFDTPDISIETQGVPSSKQFLSPGDSFNWGNKIAYRNKQ